MLKKVGEVIIAVLTNRSTKRHTCSNQLCQQMMMANDLQIHWLISKTIFDLSIYFSSE